ncbi:hypothetical protein JYU02_00810 [bacterium AH-315-P15]|nr:hypothetical protein [bacterium AH-315-P15]
MSQEVLTGLAILAGFGMLAVGSDILIRGSVSLAKALKLSPFLIGLTVVAFGTSTPELIASIRAAQLGAPGIAVGNIMGSNIANILLILGAAALITPLSADKKGFRRDAMALTISALFFSRDYAGRSGTGVGGRRHCYAHCLYYRRLSQRARVWG